MNKQLVEFYSGTGTDNRGRTFGEILAWDNRRWEHSHDMIQWLFPLVEKSAHNPHAPRLDDETITVFRTDPRVRDNVLAAYARAKDFFWDQDPPAWLRDRDHNHLRITRMLKFFTLCGFRDQASELYGNVLGVVAANPDIILPRTLDYWQDAMKAR
jgi:hypothetical protein